MIIFVNIEGVILAKKLKDKQETKRLFYLEKYLLEISKRRFDGKIMSDTSRRKGGRAVNVPDKSTEQTIKLLNDYLILINDPKFVRPSSDGHALPEMLGSYRMWGFPGNYVDDVCSFEDLLRICPIPLALDLFNHSPFFKLQGDEKLIELLKKPKHPFFRRDMTDDGFTAYEYCSHRFLELEKCYGVVTTLLLKLKQNKDRLRELGKNAGAKKEAISLDICRVSTMLQISISAGSGDKLSYTYGYESSAMIESLFLGDVERIRVCPRCRNFFWAGRKDMQACSICGEKIRKKKWRDRISQESKDQYNKERVKKRSKPKKS